MGSLRRTAWSGNPKVSGQVKITGRVCMDELGCGDAVAEIATLPEDKRQVALANERVAMVAGIALGNPMKELLASAADIDLDVGRQDRLAWLIITAQAGSLLDQRIPQLAVGGRDWARNRVSGNSFGACYR
jgi:hypothetical protein